jgi:hypothetical protein
MSGSSTHLIAKRQKDLQGGWPDYAVYAGEQLAGRIYQMHDKSWFWGVNALTVDMTVGAVMHGYATGLDEAKAKLRAAFERWLVWARAVPASDLKHPRIAAELRNMGAS